VPPTTATELRDVTNIVPPRRETVTAYDFRRPSKLSREHVRVLQMAYETFARRLTTVLTSGLRQVCQITITDISQQSYEEYVTSLQDQTFMVPLALPQLGGTGVLEFSLETALVSIDHMLGGPGGEQAPRPLTDIETTLMRALIDQIVGVLRYSLEPVVPLTPAPGNIEYNPQFLQASASTDAVVIGSFDMLVGASRCTLTLCLPLAPLLPRLMTQRPREDNDLARMAAEDTARRLRDRLGEVPVDVSVRFKALELSPTRILTLQEGDIVPIPHRVGTSLEVQAGGVTFAQAIAGKSGTRLAALIVKNPQENS
jgi:flagellar motor switch protein FliM